MASESGFTYFPQKDEWIDLVTGHYAKPVRDEKTGAITTLRVGSHTFTGTDVQVAIDALALSGDEDKEK